MIDRELTEDEATIEPIAIIGMACRVPGAEDLDEFWQNLVDGVESIRDLTEEQMLAAGAGPDRIAHARLRPARAGARRRRGVRRRALRLHAARGRDPRPAAPPVPGVRGLGAGARRLRLRALRRGRSASTPAPAPALPVYHLVPNKPLLNAVGQMAVALANNPDYIATLRLLQAEPAGAERLGAHGVLDRPRRRPPRLRSGCATGSATWRWRAPRRSS